MPRGSGGETMDSGRFTDELIEDMRGRTGTELRVTNAVANAEATASAVLRFAEGIGDDNPLWTDPAYATASCHRGLIAPPSWVLCCLSGMQFGWPGIGGFHSASRLRLHLPVIVGDRISVRCLYEGFDGPRPSRFAGRIVLDHILVEYRNQRDELVGDHRMDVTRFERGAAQQGGDRGAIELPHPWTPDELDEIDAAILAERRRGGEERRWEDVAIGDRLGLLTKGPLSLSDEIAFVATGAAPIPRLAANGAARRRYARHPKWAFRDPETKGWEPIYSVHYNAGAARQMGASFPYDVGVQRLCWLVQLLTDWAGDRSRVKLVDCQFRALVYLSDVVRLSGEVIERKVDEEGDAVVRVRTTAFNQRGTDVMPGQAVIALPSQDWRDPVSGA